MTLASRLITISSLAAFLCCFFQAVPATALSIESHAPRALHHNAHDALAKRKRSNKGKRCKPRPASSSSAAPSPSPSASPSPTMAHSSAAASPSSSPSNNGASPNIGSGKGGLAWANGNEFLSAWSGVKTMYTWSPECPSDAKSLGITCCPMLWGWRQVSDWQNNVMNTSPECIMAVNEPEIAGQSNMSPGSAVSLFRTYITPMAGRVPVIVGPATTSDPNGKIWMIEFYKQCGPDRCGVNRHGCHWYDVSGDALIAYLEDLHNTFNMRLWLTEFACQNFNNPNAPCSSGDVWAFEQKVTAFFHATSWLEKFFPFGLMQDMQGVTVDNQLMDGSGNPNALGKAYFGL